LLTSWSIRRGSISGSTRIIGAALPLGFRARGLRRWPAVSAAVCRRRTEVGRRWLIALAFRPGFTNPREAAALEPVPSVSLTVAAAYLRQQIARIRRGEQMTQACAVEGPYSHEQWVYIHLRHAELHLGFLAIETG
jgi:hypothetical protein